MARIERINLEGTTYDLGAIASTTAPGMVQVGSGLSIDANGVLSATGGSSVTLYNSLGENTDGAITQKASREMIFGNADRTAIRIGTVLDTRMRTGTIGIGNDVRFIDSYGIAIGYNSNSTGSNAIAIGRNATNTNNSVAIGPNARNDNYSSAVAIGDSAATSYYASVALGSYSQTGREGEVNIGTGTRNYGYDNTNTRVIGGVHAGVNNTDAVNVAQLNDAIAGVTINPATTTTLGGVIVGTGLSVDQTGVLSANSATLYPSTGQNTDGAMTQKATTDALALKADSSSLAAVATTGDYGDLLNTPSPYTLPAATANRLGGVKVGKGLAINANGVLSATGTTLPLYSALGENTDGPMTQKAVREALYSSSTLHSVAIGQSLGTTNDNYAVSVGHGSTASGYGSTAVGSNAKAEGSTSIALGRDSKAGRSGKQNAVAVGTGADAPEAYSVALGALAVASRVGEVNVGTGTRNYGYNSTTYRVIGGVHDGVDNHDAATVGQLNTAIASAISPITDAEIDAICV